MIETVQLQETLKARAYALDILRHVFIEEPTLPFLKLLSNPDFLDIFPFKEDDLNIKEGLQEVTNYLNSEFFLSNEGFNQLHWDFTRLIVGPFELPAPPWESSYVRKDKLLFQQTTKEVEKFYKKFGFQIAENQLEASDHIGLEIDFIFHLNGLSIKHLEENGSLPIHLLKEQHRFYKLHLKRFYSDFAKNVMKHSTTPFYKGFAKVLNGYLALDYKLIEELIHFANFSEGGSYNE